MAKVSQLPPTQVSLFALDPQASWAWDRGSIVPPELLGPCVGGSHCSQAVIPALRGQARLGVWRGDTGWGGDISPGVVPPGIDLENIVYYKDDTHYFVMTAKKQCLLRLGVLRQVGSGPGPGGRGGGPGR